VCRRCICICACGVPSAYSAVAPVLVRGCRRWVVGAWVGRGRACATAWSLANANICYRSGACWSAPVIVWLGIPVAAAPCQSACMGACTAVHSRRMRQEVWTGIHYGMQRAHVLAPAPLPGPMHAPLPGPMAVPAAVCHCSALKGGMQCRGAAEAPAASRGRPILSESWVSAADL